MHASLENYAQRGATPYGKTTGRVAMGSSTEEFRDEN